MNMATGNFGKRLAFFWLSSQGLATAGYYLLWPLMPHHQVFGGLYRMFMYHAEHPLPYIALCCFFFGLLAAGHSGAAWAARRC
jgi:hypothetical protein